MSKKRMNHAMAIAFFVMIASGVVVGLDMMTYRGQGVLMTIVLVCAFFYGASGDDEEKE